MKKVIWMGSSHKDILGFPKDVRREVGYNLDRLQRGEMPSDWKPMRAIGTGVSEIRIHADNEYRVLYVAKFEEAVYVLHAFVKKHNKLENKIYS